MTKKTYINEPEVLRLKPDMEKPNEDHYSGRSFITGKTYFNKSDYHKDLKYYNAALAASPTYPKSGDWSGYEIGAEIPDDEVEISQRFVFHEGSYYGKCCICDGQFIGDKRQPACKECCETVVAIPKKREVVEGSEVLEFYEYVEDKPRPIYHDVFRKLLNSYDKEEISMSKFVEELNNLAYKWHKSILNQNKQV